MKNIYLFLAIVGALVPLWFFYGFFNQTSFVEFIPALFVNGAAGGFSADLLISSFVFWLFMFNDKENSPAPTVYIVLNLTIGLSCALPAYLYAKEHKKQSNIT